MSNVQTLHHVTMTWRKPSALFLMNTKAHHIAVSHNGSTLGSKLFFQVDRLDRFFLGGIYCIFRLVAFNWYKVRDECRQLFSLKS